MLGDEDIFALLVQAETFELVDADGNIVGRFDSAPPIATPASSLDLIHLDPAVVDSSLRWTKSDPPNTSEVVQRVLLSGPATAPSAPALDPPALDLSRSNAGSLVQEAVLRAGRPELAVPANSPQVRVRSGVAFGNRTTAIINNDDVTIDALGTPGRVTINATQRVTLNAGTAGFWLGGRGAFPLTGVGTATCGVFVLGAALAAVPGLSTTLNSCVTGDLIEVELCADLRVQTGAGVAGAQYIIANPRVNGSTAPFANRGAYTWLDAAGGGKQLGATLTTHGWYTIPANGNYTFDVAALYSGAGLGGSVGQVDGAHTYLSVKRFSTV